MKEITVEILWYALMMFIILMAMSWVIAAYNCNKLYFYLRKNNRKKWEKMVLLPNLGFGIINVFKFATYIFSEDSIKERKILNYKKRTRRYVLLGVLLFGVIVCIVMAMIFLFG